MTTTTALRDELKRRVDAIEGGYEMMLAYAAQGLPGDQAAASGSQLREALGRFEDALSDLPDVVRRLAAEAQPDRAAAFSDFIEVLDRDARAARAALRVVVVQPSISSLLIDNLNASVHVRALLTDVFVLDEALKPRP